MSDHVDEINQRLELLLHDKRKNAPIPMEGETRSVDGAADSKRQRRTTSER